MLLFFWLVCENSLDYIKWSIICSTVVAKDCIFFVTEVLDRENDEDDP